MISPWLSIRELRDLITRGEVLPSEILEASIQRCIRYNSEIGALLELFERGTLSECVENSGPLAGIPGVVKDNICMRGRRMSCASRILEGYVAPYSATAINKLEAAGAQCIGRANCDEFAMGTSTETSGYQLTYNPWKRDRSPGGSSGGSAAAVAAGFVPWALGSETGGSVRHPAAFCGVVGSKPTYGLVSRYGLTAYASSTDQIGVLTRTVYDNALVLSVIAGREEPVRDSTARAASAPYDFTKGLTGTIRPGLRIGVLDSLLNAQGMHGEVVGALRQACEVLRALGAELRPVELTTMPLSAATYFVISRAEGASNLARFDGIHYGTRAQAKTLEDVYVHTRAKGFGEEVQRRILLGNYVLSHGHADAYYRRACEVRALMRAEAEQIFKEVDLLFAPVTPMPAFPIGAFAGNPLELDLQDMFTCWANLVGIPALSVPCGFTTEQLPVAFQLMGNHWSESLLFSSAYAYEQSTPWHTMHPEL